MLYQNEEECLYFTVEDNFTRGSAALLRNQLLLMPQEISSPDHDIFRGWSFPTTLGSRNRFQSITMEEIQGKARGLFSMS